ncbi:biotin--[acetyl-CoA-carboxylase] ligase [Rhizocola hellebori]|uniref:biotin--[biotin carboxyl-carrier protein] ligase n=1 Tax=Rhizocola hellebori TaxID=1392758 RepID=A0A8J3QE86_9ACTN|nr:biotin--[acetyl-CoA-carboxylase] ligase [Rhizocola hellebori]GIH09195.1 biotin--[acetyl-CoA-carboxylase] ligase [Rhizocola hellebori]
MPPPVLDRRRLRDLAFWRVEVKAETASTNTDVIEQAKSGADEGVVVIAESQSAGRGRLGRTWISQPSAGIWLTALLRPKVESARWGWIPLLAGVALADTVNDLHGVKADLKWPNDLLIDGRKCAGILAEVASPGAVVVGVGLNVWQRSADLPMTATGLPATSLRLAGVLDADRTALTIGFLQRLRERYESWQQAPESIVDPYRQRCATIGRDVRIMLPDNRQILGEAITVDDDGRLVLRDEQEQLCPIAAGDVTHVR